MPGPRDKRHRTRRSALLKRTTGIPIRHRGGRTTGDARFSCGTASRIDRPLNHHGRCRTNLKRRQAHNVRDQRLAETAFQNRQACSRVRCIALFGAGAAEGETLHLATDGILPRTRGCTPARIARQSRQRTEETSTARIHPAIRTTNGRFQRLDAASALSAP